MWNYLQYTPVFICICMYISIYVYRWAFSALLLPTCKTPPPPCTGWEKKFRRHRHGWPIAASWTGQWIAWLGSMLGSNPRQISFFLGKNTRPKARVCDPVVWVVWWFLWFLWFVSLFHGLSGFLSFFSCHMPIWLMIVSCPLAPSNKILDFWIHRVGTAWAAHNLTEMCRQRDCLIYGRSFSFGNEEGFWTAEDVWLTFPIADLGTMNGRGRNLKHDFSSGSGKTGKMPFMSCNGKVCWWWWLVN